MRKFKRLLRPLKDPRAGNIRHDLLEIVIIALAATLAGARTCTEFEFFGHGRVELLRRFLELRHGIPSHDTFSNVLRALDPKGLEEVLRKFSKGFGIKGWSVSTARPCAEPLRADGRLPRCIWSMSGR